MQQQPNSEQVGGAQNTLQVARLIESQNVTADSMGVPKLIKGVAKDRRISIEDPDMRHGRKSRSQKIDGYKRHILKDLQDLRMNAICSVWLKREG